MQSRRQLTIPYILFILLGAVALVGCASSTKIRSDYDHDADFGSYRTYNFIENAGAATGSYRNLFSKYMIEAISFEMEKRGYTKSDNPDLLVNFNGIFEERTEVSTRPAAQPMGVGYYGYRRGYYGGWSSYGYANETTVSQYTHGTFNIDLVDNRQKQLVWEAVGVGRVSQKQLKNLEKGIKRGVPRFFAFYPYLAGNPNPVAEK